MKTGTLLVIGDIHLKSKNIRRSEKVLEEIIRIINEKRPSLGTVILGDVFNDHGIIHLTCLKLYSEFIEKACRPRLIHILGNHEMVNSIELLPQCHALTPFKHHQFASGQMAEPACYVPVTKPLALYLSEIDTHLGFIPFIPPKTEFHAIVSEMKASYDIPLIFCHQEFEGAVFNSKAEQSKIGDEIPAFPVISGHIHHQQEIGPVWYPGTPVQSNFGETSDKSVFLIEINPKEVIPYKIVEKITLDVPKFITHKLTTEQVRSFEFDKTEDLRRFVIEGTRSKLLALKATEEFQKLSQQGKVKLVVKEEEKVTKEKTEQKTFQQLLTEYVSKEGLEDVYSSVFN